MKSLINGFLDTYRRIFTHGGVLLLLVGSIGIYSMFYPLPYLREVVKNSPVGVVDLDRSSLSRQLTRWIDAHENIEVTLRADSPSELEAALAKGEIAGYLLIPDGFRADVLRRRKTVIVYGGDAGRFLVLKQVLTGFAESVGTLSAGIDIRRQLAAGMNVQQAKTAHQRQDAPVKVRVDCRWACPVQRR